MDEIIIIKADERILRDISARFFGDDTNKCHITKQNNLSGETSVWILSASLAVQVFPHVLTFIKDHKANKTVTEVEFRKGNKVFRSTNPTPETQKLFMEAWAAENKKNR